MKPHGKHVQPLAGPEKAFGEAFRKLRKRNRISQETVSEKAGCDRTTVSLVERGLVLRVVDEGEGAVVVGTPVEGRWKAGTVPAPGPPPMRRISTPSTTAVTITAIARPSTM